MHYNVVKPWPEAKPKTARKVYETKKNSFIDDISNPKRFHPPGVGTYNLRMTDAQIKEMQNKLKEKKILISRKDNIFSQNEWLSNLQPGPGNYNPHEILKKDKPPAPWDNPKEQKKKYQE